MESGILEKYTYFVCNVSVIIKSYDSALNETKLGFFSPNFNLVEWICIFFTEGS